MVDGNFFDTLPKIDRLVMQNHPLNSAFDDLIPRKI